MRIRRRGGARAGHGRRRRADRRRRRKGRCRRRASCSRKPSSLASRRCRHQQGRSPGRAGGGGAQRDFDLFIDLDASRSPARLSGHLHEWKRARDARPRAGGRPAAAVRSHVDHVPAPTGSVDAPLQMHVTNLDYERLPRAASPSDASSTARSQIGDEVAVHPTVANRNAKVTSCSPMTG